MTIAPVDTGLNGWAEDAVGASLGARHALQLVPGGGAYERRRHGSHGRGPHPRAEGTSERGVALAYKVVSPDAWRNDDVTQRRARRVAALRRRRAVMLAGVAAGLVCGLALPFAALGGSPAAPGGSLAAPGGSLAAPGETIYVVRPGDTLWSIAARFDRGGDPRPLAEELARETGSAMVVSGERIVIP